MNVTETSAEGLKREFKITVPEPDFSDLGIERLVAAVPDEDVDRALERLAEAQRKSEPVERPAENGDILLADVVGRVGDQEIAGSRGEGREIELGTAGYLPGFTDQLVGASAGDQRTVRVT